VNDDGEDNNYKSIRQGSLAAASFNGSSYMVLGLVPGSTSRDVSVLMTLKPLRLSAGLILYSSQFHDGAGDYISLALHNAHIEFRSVYLTLGYKLSSKLIVDSPPCGFIAMWVYRQARLSPCGFFPT